MIEFKNWLEDRFEFCADKSSAFETKTGGDYYKGKAEAFNEAHQYLLENVVSDPRVHEQKKPVCQHYWIKLAPLDPYKQKYMCLNCDEVKG
jgi:hypothetical protein